MLIGGIYLPRPSKSARECCVNNRTGTKSIHGKVLDFVCNTNESYSSLNSPTQVKVLLSRSLRIESKFIFPSVLCIKTQMCSETKINVGYNLFISTMLTVAGRLLVKVMHVLITRTPWLSAILYPELF